MESRTEVLANGRVQQITLWAKARPFSYAEVIQRWQEDETFRAFFIQLLAEAPYAAYFWETPPITRANRERPFEFVLVDSPQLAGVQANRRAFAGHFTRELVIDFANLGRDAHLIVPCPQTVQTAFPHLAAFSRTAPSAQQHALWQRVGTVVAAAIGDRPLWVSTSGLGVYWLHVRLDSRPKYYTFQPYREWDFGMVP